jgi:CheY-like chemotaxis protein
MLPVARRCTVDGATVRRQRAAARLFRRDEAGASGEGSNRQQTCMAKILVIDDEPQVRRLIKQMLTRAAHEVAEAADGDEGLACIRAQMPDLIITDILMPNREGIETIREVRRLAPTLPILVISGNAGSALYMEMAKMLGAHAALAKPFRSAELLRAVADLLAEPPQPPPS